MLRRPPRSTLFPTRRSSDLRAAARLAQAARDRLRQLDVVGLEVDVERDERRPCGRSEEHTSELQSRLHLVCRLLLEKKKNTCLCTIQIIHTYFTSQTLYSSS